MSNPHSAEVKEDKREWIVIEHNGEMKILTSDSELATKKLMKIYPNCVSRIVPASEKQRLQTEIDDLKFQLADRSEKYKIAMDKGVDVLSYRNKELQTLLDEAENIIGKLNRKTDIYLSIYKDDKQLRKYKDEAREFLGRVKK